MAAAFSIHPIDIAADTIHSSHQISRRFWGSQHSLSLSPFFVDKTRRVLSKWATFYPHVWSVSNTPKPTKQIQKASPPPFSRWHLNAIGYRGSATWIKNGRWLWNALRCQNRPALLTWAHLTPLIPPLPQSSALRIREICFFCFCFVSIQFNGNCCFSEWIL